MILTYEPSEVHLTPCSSEVNALTLEKYSVLVIRCSQQYDLNALNTLREQVQKVFPNNTVLVTYDDIDFLTIADKSYKPERPLAEEPYDTYY